MDASPFWQGKGNDRIASGGAQAVVPASGDDQILPPARHIRHWRRLAAGRQIGAPELDTALYIEGPNMIVHGSCDKDEAAASHDRPT